MTTATTAHARRTRVESSQTFGIALSCGTGCRLPAARSVWRERIERHGDGLVQCQGATGPPDRLKCVLGQRSARGGQGSIVQDSLWRRQWRAGAPAGRLPPRTRPPRVPPGPGPGRDLLLVPRTRAWPTRERNRAPAAGLPESIGQPAECWRPKSDVRGSGTVEVTARGGAAAWAVGAGRSERCRRSCSQRARSVGDCWSASASRPRVSRCGARLAPRSRSTIMRALTPANSANASWVSPATRRACRRS